MYIVLHLEVQSSALVHQLSGRSRPIAERVLIVVTVQATRSAGHCSSSSGTPTGLSEVSLHVLVRRVLMNGAISCVPRLVRTVFVLGIGVLVRERRSLVCGRAVLYWPLQHQVSNEPLSNDWSPVSYQSASSMPMASPVIPSPSSTQTLRAARQTVVQGRRFRRRIGEADLALSTVIPSANVPRQGTYMMDCLRCRHR